MKVILTGSGGFNDRETLSQCLLYPSITSIVALSCRELPISDPKLRTLLHDDFSSYPSSLMSELQEADACIDSMGTVSTSKLDFNGRVNMDYTLAAARAFLTSFAPQMASREGKKFRFVS
jgi:hypothetical protein